MQIQDVLKSKLPDNPGIYFFKKGKEILYIGKATSLRDRVRSYFSNDLISTRGSRIIDMVTLSNKIDFQKFAISSTSQLLLVIYFKIIELKGKSCHHPIETIYSWAFLMCSYF